MSEEGQQQSVITMVEKQKRAAKRYNIFINDEYAFSVHEDTMIKHRLFKGETIDLERMSIILRDEERNKAYSKALRMIGRRSHSSSEVKRKLKEYGIEQTAIEWVCEVLEQQNYINDEQFAKMWAERRIYSQRKGRNWVRQELQQKGVHKDHVQGALETINANEELEGALKIARTKWKQTSGEIVDKKRKTAAFLMRRGYTSMIVSKVLREVYAASSEEEDELLEDFSDD